MQIDALAIAQPLIVLMLLPLIIGLLIKWRYADTAARWQPHVSQAATYSLLLLFVAGVPPALPSIIGSVGSWLIPATVLLTVGAVLIGYLLAVGADSGKRKVMALGTGQRNLTGALIVAASSFGADTLVMTLVASLILTILLLLIAAEWGRRTGAEPAAAADS